MAESGHLPIQTRDLTIRSGQHRLPGMLFVPGDALGVVAFAHGSGSNRLSSRNRYVAEVLQQARLATLFFDLLEADEAEDRRNVFAIELLAARVLAATAWLKAELETQNLPIGLFGASTGAAAALVAAARDPGEIHAVVSRGGRPDLARDDLPAVQAPTLLIVGGYDDVVLRLNEDAYRLLQCPKQLVVIPGATHLFPEPGALEEVGRLAQDWFLRSRTPDPATSI